MNKETFDKLRIEQSIKSKNGIDFLLAASLIWLIVAIIWTLGYNAYSKSVLTFMATGLMMPMALVFARILKTSWKNENNPLHSLGLWLNLAQLFYFPLLVFALVRYPDYFAMVFGIITGAHFFPYSWFYKTIYYALFAGIISIGVMFLGLFLSYEKTFYIPLFISASLIILAILLVSDYKKKSAI